MAYEGALDHPTPETFYEIVERNKVTGVFTSPTAVRLLMRYGNAPARAHDLSSLERVFCAGEVLNPPAWEWFQKEAFQDKIPVSNHYWQTETGGPVVGNPVRSRTSPDQARVRRDRARRYRGSRRRCGWQGARSGEKGIFVIKRPFPGLTASLWAEPDRYKRDYWDKVPGKNRVLHRRRDLDRRRWLRLVQRAGRRDHQDRRPPHRHDRGRDRLSFVTPRWPRPASPDGR
jgi:acetyl-CoA synthetase